MLSQIRAHKRYGRVLPRSMVIEFKNQKAKERIFISRLTSVKTIDLFADLPSEPAVYGSKRIKEIVFAGLCLVVVSEGGMCRAYETHSGRFLADLNPKAPWKRKKQLVVQESVPLVNASIPQPSPGGLQCEVHVASALSEGCKVSPATATNFQNVVLSHPAFFEFDEANKLILAAQQGDVQSFQFWNHTTFKLIFSVTGEEFEEVRISHGLVAMFKPSLPDVFFATIFDIEDGTRLAEISIPLDQHRKVEFLELLVYQLLFKQDNASLRVINLLDNGASKKIMHTRDTFAPIGFVFFEAPARLNGKKYLDKRPRRFFTISKDTVQFWLLHQQELAMLHSISVPGLRDASLCQHCPLLNMLVVCPSHAPSDHELNARMSQCTFASALELHRAGNFNKKLTIQSYGQQAAPSGLTKKDFNTYSPKIEFFAIDDGHHLGSISEEYCGTNVEIVQISVEHLTLACGDHQGVVRLLQAAPGSREHSLEVDQTITTDGQLPCVPWSMCRFAQSIGTFPRDKHEVVKMCHVAQVKSHEVPHNVDNCKAHANEEENKLLSSTNCFWPTKPDPQNEFGKSDSTKITLKRQMDSQGNAQDLQFRKKAIRPQ